MKTKIIATIGPSSKSEVVLSELIKEGASILRFNLKFNTPASHGEIIDRARKAAQERGGPVEILIDFPKASCLEGVDLALKKNVDYIALSHIKNAKEVKEFKKVSTSYQLSTKVIVKIETEKALGNFSSIQNETDVIMVARGDLGKHIPIEKVPFVQKEIILACKKANKIVAVATEMLLSMVSSKEPTRAEVSDVANAVLEGSDAVMLSEETAVGKYPVESVRVMKRVIQEAEAWEKLGHVNILSNNGMGFKFGV